MVLSATSNNIVAVEETGVPVENHRHAASHCQTLSHNVVSSTFRLSGIRSHNVVVIGTDCICSFKSSYHTITIMMALCGIAKKSHYLIDNQSYLYSVGYCCKVDN